MTTIAFGLRRLAGHGVVIAAIAGSALLAPRPAAAQTPTALYERARAAESQLADAPSADAIRRAARAYEAVVLRYPASGVCDNALWQAALLLEQAWTRYGDTRDRDEAVRVLGWLAKEYPASSFARQAPARAAALKAAPTAAVAPPPTASPAPQPPAASRTTSGAVVRGITRTELPRGDRITVELSDEVSYAGERVSNPDRVFFDFSNASAAAALLDQAHALHSPLVRAVRVGSPSQGVTRVVIELTGAPRYSAFSLYGPFRVVVDIEAAAPPSPTPSPTPAAPRMAATPTFAPPLARPAATPITTPAATPAPPPSPTPTPSMTPTPSPLPTTTPAPATKTPAPSPLPTTTPATKTPTPSAPASAAPTPAPSPTDASPVPPSSTGRGDYSLARQLGLRVAKIVIDPGHGGYDPGAISNGVTESELVLDIALRLEKLLEQTPGVEVVLTRRTNEFIPLEERTAIANREHADLFLSIHANSHRQPAVRGIETYFLNFATNPDAEAVAARENAASVQTMGTLPAIVKAIALNNKLEESREFATLLQQSLTRRLRTQTGGSKDLGVKQAPFVVLIGAQMPSVLTEIAFLTNKTDASLLKQPAQRQLIAQALRDAVVRYQDSLKRVSTSGAQGGR